MSNQPPKSAEEVPTEPADELIAPMTYVARYVTDEEIDAMWPYDNTELNRVVLLQREAAKAMRDKIFNNVKSKV